MWTECSSFKGRGQTSLMPREIIPRGTLLNFTSSRELTSSSCQFSSCSGRTVLELKKCGFMNHVIPKRDFVSSRCIMRSDTKSVQPLRLTRTRKHRNVEASNHNRTQCTATSDQRLTCHIRVCNRLILMQVPAMGRESVSKRTKASPESSSPKSRPLHLEYI